MRRLELIGLLVLAVIAVIAGSSISSGKGHSTYNVRAIFDNAGFAVTGEDVRIAGAPVGSIQSLSVCTSSCPPSSPANQAAVTLSITDSRFTPWYANATCAIRPQSLIGERYVDCEPGSSNAARLQQIKSGPGAGTYLLPVTQTSSPVDFDIVQDIYREPVREQFALILDELGTGLAARGSDLNAVIHRADPALGYTDQVLQILARQNQQLAQLATDSDTVLAPLARAKRQLADFIVQANTTSTASATRAADISRSFQLFPSFLRQLNPLLVALGGLADQGTPVLADLGQSAAAQARQFENLVPFASAARTSLIDLGNSAQQSQPYLLQTVPLAHQLLNLGNAAVPTASSLDRLTASLYSTGGIDQLMKLLFYGTTSANGFDQLGHYVRAEVQVPSGCTAYQVTPTPGCSANFQNSSAAADVSAQPASASASPQATTDTAASLPPAADSSAESLAIEAVQAMHDEQSATGALRGLLRYLVGNAQ